MWFLALSKWFPPNSDGAMTGFNYLDDPVAPGISFLRKIKGRGLENFGIDKEPGWLVRRIAEEMRIDLGEIFKEVREIPSYGHSLNIFSRLDDLFPTPFGGTNLSLSRLSDRFRDEGNLWEPF